MKRLLYVRHAKSSWDDPGLSDFDRPLAQRGLRDSPRMGRYLQAREEMPEWIFSSPARRAQQTAEMIARNAGIPATSISWVEALYFTSSRAYLDVCGSANETLRHLMVVGHNPMIEEAVSMLLPDGEKHHLRMPTCAMACLEFHGSRWADIERESCELLWHMIPKKLPSEG